MSDVLLFEHNEIAYKKLIESLKNNKCTTINHATGTGKSFIALKYLYENRDKKYLYLAPTYPIIDQLLESCYKIGIKPEDINIDTMIYRNLLGQDINQIYEKYDGFIFDEYHRTGAKETYKKIKELKLKLNEHDDDKKFIGLTATPVRYLDKERNMTNEIFDGNVASELSLSESMLEELLPIPMYINSKIACRKEYEKTENKLNKMAESKEKEKIAGRLHLVGEKINNGSRDNKELINKYIKEKDGKYIVFCNTINELNKIYSEIDDWFKDIGTVNKYKVHSTVEIDRTEREKIKNVKEKNKDTLDKFNKNDKGMSILLCVDILNEGVHVENIDGVFMLRKTQSPIIYFQQIGRALSFSGRKKQIRIFDLVNNFNNHMAIDMIYKELCEELNRKIKEHPENKEKYEKNLNKFKVMDETRDILSELLEINRSLTKEKIIESQIDNSIDILRQFLDSGKNKIDVFNDNEAKRAYLVITKYNTYVNNSQFKKLLDLEILLPENLSMSMEERKELLGKYKSLYDKNLNSYNDCIDSVAEFLTKNQRLPQIESLDEEEKKLAIEYLNGLGGINENQILKLKVIIEKENVLIGPFEKVLFNKQINRKDLSKIMDLAQNYVENANVMPEYLKEAIERIIRKYDIQENKKLFELLNKSEKIKQEQIEKMQKARYVLLNKVENYLVQHIDDSVALLKESGIMGIVEKLKPRDLQYLKQKYKILKKQKCNGYLDEIGETSIKSFCSEMRDVETKDIESYYDKIEYGTKCNNFIMKLIIFMQKKDGKNPSLESKDVEERKLAKQYAEYSKDENIMLIINLIKNDKENALYSPQNMVYTAVSEKEKENTVKILILKSMEFLKKNGRRPLENSLDSIERDLALEYREKCINGLQDNEVQVLNRIFNGKQFYEKNKEQYIKNIKLRQERENIYE